MFIGSHRLNAYPFTVLPMCGIIGFTGQKNAVPYLIKGLKKLEYRGYDSSGISVFANDGILSIKSKGRITENERLIAKENPSLFSNCGIGHTRWATHGKPSDINSHPHSSDNVSLVHNGIIENYGEIRARLSSMGYKFISDTDTESVLMLIEHYYRNSKDPFIAIRKALSEIKGSYALGIIFKDYPEKIFAAKKDSPLICAKGTDGAFIASDSVALPGEITEIFRLCDGETAIITPYSIKFFDSNSKETDKLPEAIDIQSISEDKGSFPHIMLKEIHDVPIASGNTLSAYIKNNFPDFGIDTLVYKKISECNRIHIVACGTAMNAGLIGKHYIEKYTRIPVNVETASEFRYRNPILSKDDIFIALSQSGETADTLAALRLAKNNGLFALSIVNVKGSTIANESDGVIYTLAGREIAVASTKAYTVQCITLYLIALLFANARKTISDKDIREKCAFLSDKLSVTLGETLSLSQSIRNICTKLCKNENLFFIGRGIDFLLAQEASLKLKEISYIHSEAYAAGELKHGTISLIEDGTPVIAIITDKNLFEKTVSNIKEVKARGASVFAICSSDIEIPVDVCENVITVPYISDGLTFLTASVAFQLLAYHTADMKGCEIDKPRNLAKSVTVE